MCVIFWPNFDEMSSKYDKLFKFEKRLFYQMYTNRGLSVLVNYMYVDKIFFFISNAVFGQLVEDNVINRYKSAKLVRKSESRAEIEHFYNKNSYLCQYFVMIASTITYHYYFRCTRHKILDMAFYDEKTISMLIIEDHKDELPVLVQVPLDTIADDMYTVCNPEMGVEQTNLWVY